MATPSTDSAAIKATIKALMSDGWELVEVNDGSDLLTERGAPVISQAQMWEWCHGTYATPGTLKAAVRNAYSEGSAHADMGPELARARFRALAANGPTEVSAAFRLGYEYRSAMHLD